MSKTVYTKAGQLYENVDASVAVYFGYSQPAGIPVVIKEQIFDDIQDTNYALTEALMQIKLDHPHICKIYDAKIEACATGFLFSLILEYMEGGDLHQEIVRRQEKNQYWTELELLQYLEQLSSALDYAQTHGVAHRDIKPQNIFRDATGKLKIGDFGSSSNNSILKSQSTLIGSPYYLSPELKGMFLKPGTPIQYDPFKSDVYSLGVTLCYMGLLGQEETFMVASNLKEGIEQVLNHMQGYPNLQVYLKEMLEIDPEKRTSFASLSSCASFQIQKYQIHSTQTFRNQTPQYDTPKAPLSLPCYKSQQTIPCYMCNTYVSEDNLWNQHLQTQGQQWNTHFPTICSELCYYELFKKLSQKCCICASVLSTQLQLTPEQKTYYQAYQPYFQYLCSFKCLETFCFLSETSDGHSKCVNCQLAIDPLMQTLQGSSPFLLECRHALHGCTCFVSYLAATSANFHQAVQHLCPICKVPISNFFIQSCVRDFPDFDIERNQVFYSSCQICGEVIDIVLLPCNHIICKGCGEKVGWICTFCTSAR